MFSVDNAKIILFCCTRNRFKIGYKNCHPPVYEIQIFFSHRTRQKGKIKYWCAESEKKLKSEYFAWKIFVATKEKMMKFLKWTGWINDSWKKKLYSESPIPLLERPSRCLWFSRSFAYNGSFFFSYEFLKKKLEIGNGFSYEQSL